MTWLTTTPQQVEAEPQTSGPISHRRYSPPLELAVRNRKDLISRLAETATNNGNTSNTSNTDNNDNNNVIAANNGNNNGN